MRTHNNVSFNNYAHMKRSYGEAADNLQKAEDKLLTAYDKGDEKEIAKAQVEYQKQQRIFSMFATMVKNMHDLMMTLIRMLRLQ